MGNKTLVIVESPTKAKTINKYLGRNYEVISSMGHIIDLPKSRMAVDVEKDFEPDYITVRGRGKILKELRERAKQSKEVLLASDEDREGEAIAFHIKNALEKSNPDLKVKRIVFNEITKDAILKAVSQPGKIDMKKVDAQKARRVLDRLVGYNISPILWKKVKKGLSAGRVQSVALKLICEREEEIENFVPKEYWKIDAEFLDNKKKKFVAHLHKYGTGKLEINNKKEVDKILKELEKEDFILKSITEKDRKKRPVPPFTTSKMQQEAANKLNFTSDKTMKVAQSLYEGIEIGKEAAGLITYMRTDSTRISEGALKDVRTFIGSKYGDKYLPDKANYYKNKKNTQDAHEAIRPTDVLREPKIIKQYLNNDQYKLYNLIWEKFVSSQMEDAKYHNVVMDITAGKSTFRISASKLTFDGFLKVYKSTDVDDDFGIALPDIKKGDKVKLKKFIPTQHFTEPPPRYTDASIVKKLEESGIGRPSTYAPIITTLFKRYYVTRNKKQLEPTELGILTNMLLSKHFQNIMDVNFTAEIENKLDKVEEDEMEWVNVLKEFYGGFIETVNQANEKIESMKNLLDKETDEICEKCGRNMVKKLGRFGYFLACPGFPDCKNTKPIPLGKCPMKGCDGDVVTAVAKKGRKKTFYRCSKYPDCKFSSWGKPGTKAFEREMKKKYSEDEIDFEMVKSEFDKIEDEKLSTSKIKEAIDV